MSIKEHYLKHFFQMKKWDDEFLEDFFQKINHLMPESEFLSDEQHTLLFDIQQALIKIKHTLAPLYDANLIREIGIAGGAIRDLILNKNANDLDIVVSLNLYSDDKDKIYTKDLSTHLLDWMQQAQVIHKVYSTSPYNNEVETKTFVLTPDLMRVLTEKIKPLGKLYVNHDNTTADYQNKHIMGIIKTQMNTRPVDIIFTQENVLNYANTFSFDICNGFLIYDQILSDASEQECINHIVLSKHMVHDIEKKTLTTNISNINMEHLEYYLSKHYLKMKEKFPEYSLEYRVTSHGGPSANEIEAMKQRINQVRYQEQYDKLNEKLPQKEEKGKLKI